MKINFDNPNKKGKNMKKTCLLIVILIFSLITGFAAGTTAKEELLTAEFEEVVIKSADGVETDASFFEGKSGRAVIFAPGSRYNKKSWYALAEHFQKQKLSSLPLNTGNEKDILNAIHFLKKKGIEKITVVGASMGGIGTLNALQGDVDQLVDSAILLAPAGGFPIKHSYIRKLFIVSEDDMIASSAEVYNLCMDSAKPRIYKEFGGSDHAQELLAGEYKEEVIKLMLDFIRTQ